MNWPLFAAGSPLPSGDSIDALVNKQLAALKQADTLFKDAVSIVEIYRKKHPELDQYIPSVALIISRLLAFDRATLSYPLAFGSGAVSLSWPSRSGNPELNRA